MQDEPALSLYHDTRRSVKDGTYPVKVRVTWQVYINAKAKYIVKYFPTGVNCSTEDYAKITDIDNNVRGRLKELQEKIFEARERGSSIIKKNKRVSYQQFAHQFSGKTSSVATVKHMMDELIGEKITSGKIGTVENYEHAKKSILEYAKGDIYLVSIDAKWLKAYEEDRVKAGRSLNTVGMYLRALRAAFNRAIDSKLISFESYPFRRQAGAKGYQIRKKRTKKRSLSVTAKDAFVSFKTDHAGESKALDYALFSYYSNGMNFADMAHLRPENFSTESFRFIRRKTMHTVKEQVEIEVQLTDKIKAILKRRGGHTPYVFGIINDRMDAETKHKVIKQWRKVTNKWINKIAQRMGYPHRITTLSMRNMFVSMLANAGVPLTAIRPKLGHTTYQTTAIYAEDLSTDDVNSLL